MDSISTVFAKILGLATVLGIANINLLPEAWEYKLDESWQFAVNGHDHDIEIFGDRKRMGVTIPKFSVAVWYNGWLAGLLDPIGGVMAAGESANEEAFIEVLDKAIKEASNE